jgi:hypothetical protein
LRRLQVAAGAGAVKCARCKRPLDKVTAQIGAFSFGPKCAERLGLIEAISSIKKHAFVIGRAKASQRGKFSDQFDLFEIEVHHG